MAKSENTIRVVSYNIHKGFSVGNVRFVLESIRESIRAIDADLVFLQEVQGEHNQKEKKIEQWPQQSQFEFLADEVWHHFAYGKNAVYDEGHHGNAILSRFPITSWENIDISQSRYAKRGLLHAVVDIPGWERPLHAVCSHFDLLKTDQKAQAKRLVARIEKHVPSDCRLVIGGDFNDWSQGLSHYLEQELSLKEVFLASRGAHARTFPAQLPALKLDRIYFRGFDVLDAKRLHKGKWKKLSDHLAIVADLSPHSLEDSKTA